MNQILFVKAGSENTDFFIPWVSGHVRIGVARVGSVACFLYAYV